MSGCSQPSTPPCRWITDILPNDLAAEGPDKRLPLLIFKCNSLWMGKSNSTRLDEIGESLLTNCYLRRGLLPSSRCTFKGRIPKSFTVGKNQLVRWTIRSEEHTSE